MQVDLNFISTTFVCNSWRRGREEFLSLNRVEWCYTALLGFITFEVVNGMQKNFVVFDL